MKYDAAVERRKRALADALKSLMQKKALSQITINDIVSECGVNRKTFYYHFEDIYALLKWMLEQDAIEVVRNYDLLMQPEDAVAFVIDYVKASRHLLNCACDTMGRDEMRIFFIRIFSACSTGLSAGRKSSSDWIQEKTSGIFSANSIRKHLPAF